MIQIWFVKPSGTIAY